MRLLDYARNVYSQTGEDGILEHILSIIGDLNRWCVEFGAWDGEHLSNTRNLTENHSFRCVLIEANQRRFEALKAKFDSDPNVVLVNQFVGLDSNDGLDNILINIDIPKDFDLLSIDIDGNDIHVWSDVLIYRPKVVCIEYNPSIDTSIHFAQPRDGAIQQGASLLALDKMAKSKGYSLVAATKLNAIFVRDDLFSLFNINDNSPQSLREDTSWVTHIFTGYDGTIFITGHGKILWHDIPYSNLIPQIPWLIRNFPDDFGKIKRIFLRAFKFMKKNWGRFRSMGKYLPGN